MNEKTPVIGRNRPANNPGGMQCERCGEIFIGEEWHTLCGICIQTTADEIAKAQQPDRPSSAPGREELRVTDEMVEAAAKEFQRHAWPDCSWDGIHESGRERYRKAARDGLNAALALISNGTGEATP